jgi:hypothetical protein
MKRTFIFLLLGLLTFPALPQKFKATTYEFPDPVDTRTREIAYQEKKIFGNEETGVYVRNDFPAGRVNNFQHVNGNLFELKIEPENHPINMSPWYAFKIWSTEKKRIWVQFTYEHGVHRYIPKLSSDGETWQPIDEEHFTFVQEGSAVMNIEVSADTLWVAAQEIMDSRRVGAWCKELAADDRISFAIAGQSARGRDLFFMDINNGKTKKKDIVAIISRQHPPEVTGFLALQAFLDELLSNEQSADFFKQYRVLVYPLMNPDGVDEGHWRHNTGGIDLNRDWAYYNQPETRQVADHMVNQVNSSRARVVLGLDFHSTQKDVFYTFPDEGPKSVIPGFKKPWLEGIEASIRAAGMAYDLNEGPSGIGQPVSKGWFYTQFNAEGVTYEVGDETPREFIDLKGRVAAQQMIRVLLENE